MENTSGIAKAIPPNTIDDSGNIESIPIKRREIDKNKAKEDTILQKLQLVCSKGDPSRIYVGLNKIGQGYI